MKNGHSEDDAIHTLGELKILWVIFTMKVLPWNWLKLRVPKECCGYFSHPLDVYEASPGQTIWTRRLYCRNSSEKLPRTF